MNEFLIYALCLGGTAVAGGVVVQLFGERLIRHLNLILAFGGAYLIGLAFLHLVPEVFISAASGNGISVREAGFLVLAGFLLQLVLEYLSGGVEHGHYHRGQPGSGFPLMVLISLCIHAFIEAMPLAGGMHHDHHAHAHVHMHLEGSSLLLGIMIHKFPVALVLGGLLLTSGISAQKRWMGILLFAAMPVLGMWAGDALIHAKAWDPTSIIQVLTALMIGILFHISTTIIFETSDGHRFNSRKLAVVIVGMVVAALTL